MPLVQAAGRSLNYEWLDGPAGARIVQAVARQKKYKRRSFSA